MASQPESFRCWVARLAVATGRQLRASRSPVTGWLVATVLVVFAVQVAAAVQLGLSTSVLTTSLFYVEPHLAWPLALFLHRGPIHAAMNVLLVGYLGRLLESHFGARAYVSFLVVAAVASVVGSVAVVLAFDSGPIAAYGASGVGFALSGYALQYPLRGDPTPGEWLAAIVGVAAVAVVGWDLATGPFFHPDWVNGAHLAGLVVGLAAAVVKPLSGTGDAYLRV